MAALDGVKATLMDAERHTQCLLDSSCGLLKPVRSKESSLAAAAAEEGCGLRAGGFVGMSRECGSRRRRSSGAWRSVTLQACFAVLLFVSVTTLASASARHSGPGLAGSSTAGAAAWRLMYASPARSRSNRGIGASESHWDLYKLVEFKQRLPTAQCEAGCMSRTATLDAVDWQPFHCDGNCKECRNISCRTSADLTGCLDQCNETSGIALCQEMCDVVHGKPTESKAGDLPEVPKTGPQPIGSQVLSSQWLMWVGLERVDETDSEEMQRSEATLYVVRRMQLRLNKTKHVIEETAVSQYLTAKSAIRTKRLFRSSTLPTLPGQACYRFEVAAVNRNGLKGFMRNEDVYHPSHFGLEANSTAPCWKRLCVDSGPVPTGRVLDYTVAVRDYQWSNGYWSVNVTWSSVGSPTTRCHRLIVTTPDADRARCGQDREILLTEKSSSVLLHSLVEQCHFNVTVHDLPSYMSASVKFRTPNSDQARRAQDVQVSQVQFDTASVRPSVGSKLYLSANITWKQPQVQHTVRGFCLHLFKTNNRMISHPLPTYMQCRKSRIPASQDADAVYTKNLRGLEANQQYQLEIATMLSNRHSTVTKTVFFTTPKLQPSNVRLLSLNKTRSLGVIGWTFNKVMSLKAQGGKMRLVWLEVPLSSFLAKEIEQEEADAKTRVLYESSTEGVESRLIGDPATRRGTTTTDDSGSVVPSSTLSSLSDWATLQQYIESNSSHSGILEVELQDKDTYTVELHDIRKESQYLIVVFGPAMGGEPGMASPKLLFSTTAKGNTGKTGDGDDDKTGTKTTGTFWTQGHMASVLVPSAGAVILLLILVVVLIVVYLCKQGGRGAGGRAARSRTSAVSAAAARRRKTRTSFDGMTMQSLNDMACFSARPHPGPGSVPSRPATWIAHDANAVPQHAPNNPRQPIIADGDGDVAYSPFSALSSPSHPARRVASFSGVGSPSNSRRALLGVGGGEGPAIELRRAPSGRSCVHAVEFSAVRPGSPHPEKNLFLSTIYGETAFTRDSLRRTKSSMAAIDVQVPKTSPKPFRVPNSPENAYAKENSRKVEITKTSTASQMPRVSLCSEPLGAEYHSSCYSTATVS